MTSAAFKAIKGAMQQSELWSCGRLGHQCILFPTFMPIQVPEHTWGVDIKKALGDYTHWSNHKFHQQVDMLGWKSRRCTFGGGGTQLPSLYGSPAPDVSAEEGSNDETWDTPAAISHEPQPPAVEEQGPRLPRHGAILAPAARLQPMGRPGTR